MCVGEMYIPLYTCLHGYTVCMYVLLDVYLVKQLRDRSPLAEGPNGELVCWVGLHGCKDGGDDDVLGRALIALHRHHWQQPEAAREHLQAPFQRPAQQTSTIHLWAQRSGFYSAIFQSCFAASVQTGAHMPDMAPTCPSSALDSTPHCKITLRPSQLHITLSCGMTAG